MRHSPLLFALPFVVVLASPVHASFSDLRTDQQGCEGYEGLCSFDNENAYAINALEADGIVQGYADGTFRPDNHINRAEFTKIVVLSKYSQAETDACTVRYPGLSDVPTGAWYARYVCMGTQNAGIEGYPNDRTFRPSNEINFAEAAKILANLYLQPVHGQHEDWFEPYVDALAAAHAIPQSIRGFSQPVTRGEMAEMLWRLRSKTTEKPSATFAEIDSRSLGTLNGYKLQRTEPNGEVSDFVFSKDVEKVAFEAIKPDGAAVVYDGEKFQFPHDWKLAGVQPVFSDDGRQLAYFIGTDKRTVVINGKKGKTYDDAWDLRYLPSDDTFVYLAKRGNEYVLVHGTEERDRYTASDGDLPSFAHGMSELQVAPDGRTLAYTIKQPYGEMFVIGGKEQKAYSAGRYDSVQSHSLVFSADSRHFVYSVYGGAGVGYMVVHDGREYGNYDDVNSLAVSGDGRHSAFLAYKEDGVSFLVYDGKEVPGVLQPMAPVFAPDGRLYFSARRTADGPNAVLAYDGSSLSERMAIPADLRGDRITLSADGEHVAVWVSADRTGGTYTGMLVDGVLGPDMGYGGILGVVFRYGHTAYVGGPGSFYAVVVDQKMSARHFRFIPSAPVFSQDGRYITYGASDGASDGYSFQRVTEKVADIGK
jgi:hypothetical protein